METYVPREIQSAVNNMGNFQGSFNLDKSGFNPNMPG
ncbi:MAG TPA: ferritin Dps family protein, partial [Clostridia bacterium]|nr:ferritin Dps family protein [Clostridia bacterium]